MKIDERTEGDVVVLEVKERRVDARNAAALKEAIGERVVRGHEWIVVDLTAVEFVDSSGLAAMISALKLLGRKGDLAVSGAGEHVGELFAQTRLDKVFRLFPTSADAVRALAGRTA